MTARDLAGLVRDLPAALGPYVRVSKRAVRAGLQAATVTDASAEVLQVVDAEPGVSVGRVAEQLGVAANTVSTLVRELVDAGLVERRRDERDRRAAALHLTASAPERIAAWVRRRDEVLTIALHRLPEQEREALRRALPAVRHLLEALEQVGQERGASTSAGTGSAASGPPALVP